MGKKLERNKMPSAEENNNGGSLNEYEQQRNEIVQSNKRKLAELDSRRTINSMSQQDQPRKLQKKNTTEVLQQLNLQTCAHDNEETMLNMDRNRCLLNCIPLEIFLTTMKIFALTTQAKAQNIREKGRGITMKDDIFSRTPDMPKIMILLNDCGQPIGKNARQLSSIIGCHVRRKLSLASLDWRLVDAVKKYELWTDIKEFYDIDDHGMNWFMRTAARKWKEFKATIKELYLKPEMTIEEVGESRDKRINDADWKFLFDYWMSPEFKVHSEIAKKNGAKLDLHHTSDSVSYACSEYDLAVELGHPPRRDENFVKTHTRKTGVPSKKAAPIINQLKEIVEAHLELKEPTIQEGDAFAAVCGEKEPRGYVRVLGLGPTPQDIRTPGWKCYAPTRLQIEIFARKKVENEKAALEQRVHHLQTRIDLIEQRTQQERASLEPMSQNGSTTRHNNVSLQDIGVLEQDQDEEDVSEEEECYDDDQDFPR